MQKKKEEEASKLLSNADLAHKNVILKKKVPVTHKTTDLHKQQNRFKRVGECAICSGL